MNPIRCFLDGEGAEDKIGDGKKLLSVLKNINNNNKNITSISKNYPDGSRIVAHLNVKGIDTVKIECKSQGKVEKKEERYRENTSTYLALAIECYSWIESEDKQYSNYVPDRIAIIKDLNTVKYLYKPKILDEINNKRYQSSIDIYGSDGYECPNSCYSADKSFYTRTDTIENNVRITELWNISTGDYDEDIWSGEFPSESTTSYTGGPVGDLTNYPSEYYSEYYSSGEFPYRGEIFGESISTTINTSGYVYRYTYGGITSDINGNYSIVGTQRYISESDTININIPLDSETKPFSNKSDGYYYEIRDKIFDTYTTVGDVAPYSLDITPGNVNNGESYVETRKYVIHDSINNYDGYINIVPSFTLSSSGFYDTSGYFGGSGGIFNYKKNPLIVLSYAPFVSTTSGTQADPVRVYATGGKLNKMWYSMYYKGELLEREDGFERVGDYNFTYKYKDKNGNEIKNSDGESYYTGGYSQIIPVIVEEYTKEKY